MGSERLQKILSARGLASRRQAEEWIRRGRVRVNGSVVTELGFKADPERDRVEVDGVPVPEKRGPVVVLLNKPAGYTATVRDPHAEKTVMDLLVGLERRVYPVGRLDRDSRGVLLLTDDGDLANALLHPSHGVEKVYAVTVAGELSADALRRLASGVEVEDTVTRPTRLSHLARAPGATRFRIALREGRKRQVRLMVRAVGARVTDLERVSFAGLSAGGLAEGQWRMLKPAEVERLRAAGSAGELPGRLPLRAPRKGRREGRPRAGGPQQAKRRGGQRKWTQSGKAEKS